MTVGVLPVPTASSIAQVSMASEIIEKLVFLNIKGSGKTNKMCGNAAFARSFFLQPLRSLNDGVLPVARTSAWIGWMYGEL